MNNKIKFIAFALTVFFSFSSYAQDEDLTDWESWNSIGVKYKLNKKWSFSLEEHLRLKEDISEISRYFTQLGAQYKINKHFKVGAAARYISKNDNTGAVQGYENYFRYHIG